MKVTASFAHLGEAGSARENQVKGGRMIPETRKGFSCCAERHLVNSGLALLAIYSKLFALSSGQIGNHEYFGTLGTLAEFFGKPYNSIWRAKEVLVKLGFLECLPETTNGQGVAFFFRTKRYRVISHNEWAERNPGKCYQALEMPWDEHGDPLARRLLCGQTRFVLPLTVSSHLRRGNVTLTGSNLEFFSTLVAPHYI